MTSGIGNGCFVQDGNSIQHLPNTTPEAFQLQNSGKSLSWRIWLFKAGFPTSLDVRDRNCWGSLSSSTSQGALEQLRNAQKQEKLWEQSTKIHWGVCTHFNPLGPIAVVEDLSTKVAKKKRGALLGLSEIKQGVLDGLLVATEIIQAPDNPFKHVGENVLEYGSALMNAGRQAAEIHRTIEGMLLPKEEDIESAVNAIAKELTVIDTHGRVVKAQLVQFDTSSSSSSARRPTYNLNETNWRWTNGRLSSHTYLQGDVLHNVFTGSQGSSSCRYIPLAHVNLLLLQNSIRGNDVEYVRTAGGKFGSGITREEMYPWTLIQDNGEHVKNARDQVDLSFVSREKADEFLAVIEHRRGVSPTTTQHTAPQPSKNDLVSRILAQLEQKSAHVQSFQAAARKNDEEWGLGDLRTIAAAKATPPANPYAGTSSSSFSNRNPYAAQPTRQNPYAGQPAHPNPYAEPPRSNPYSNQ